MVSVFAFASFHDENLKNKDIIKFVYKLLKRFTIVYIIKCPFSSSKFKNSSVICQYTNKQDDDNGIILIDTINPLIKSYSIRICVNCDDELFQKESNIYIHIDYVNLNSVDFLDAIDVVNHKANIFLSQVLIYKYKQSILVLDLDDTIINKDGKYMIKDIKIVLHELMQLYDLVVLWSHGCSRHVNNSLQTSIQELDFKFDHIITKTTDTLSRNKGFGRIFKDLNLKYGIGEVSFSTLIDDQANNFVGDYDCFLHVPSYDVCQLEYKNIIITLKNYIRKVFLKIDNQPKLNLISNDY